MKSILSTILFLILNFLTAGNALAAFTGPAIPQAIPFTQNGKTYGAYVQAWHPYYGQSQICYYPTDFNQAYAPIIAKSDVVYGGLVNIRLHLNPASSSQAWDSEAYYTTNLLCARYQNGNWVSSPTTPDNLLNGQYNWGDWYFLDHDAYGLTDDLVRAVGINIKVNATYDFSGQFGLGSYTSGDVMVAGGALFASPVTNFASRTVNMAFGASWVRDCPLGTPKKHGGTDVSASYAEDVYAAHHGTVKDIHYQAGWAYAVVIEDSSGSFTTVNWHVNAYGGLAVNDTVVPGQKIATVANLGSNTHFHFGIRSGPYNASLSLAGSLPVASCGGYPAYPENLFNPAVLTYQ